MSAIDQNPTEGTKLCACACGCGGQTKVATWTDRNRGCVKGQPRKYIHGHNSRKPDRYVEVDAGYATPCWIWRLARDRDGYGKVRHGNRMVLAHRHYYEREHGPLPDGLELDHLCRERGCVRPSHLEPVSHAENCRRGQRTKLTPSQVAEIRGSSDPQRVIARRYGVTQGHVSRIRGGQAWRS